jgi:nucleotide-binding universal stress UspA family protein
MTQSKETTMYRKILVGYDDSDQAKDALALGKQLADAIGAELVVAGVFQFDPVWGGADSRFQDADTEFTRQVSDAASATGAHAETVPSSSPARGLHDLAEEIEADLILVGSAHHGRFGRSLAGTTGVALLHGAPCAVGVAPRGYREEAESGIRTVTAGIDGSGESRHALRAAIELAARSGAKLKLISVAVPPPVGTGKAGPGGWHAVLEAIEQDSREQLAEARATVPDDVDVEATMISGDAVDSLASASGAPGTVMILGSRGYGPFRRVLLGTVATRLVAAAPCPLIVTPRGIRETAEGESAEAVESAS